MNSNKMREKNKIIQRFNSCSLKRWLIIFHLGLFLSIILSGITQPPPQDANRKDKQGQRAPKPRQGNNRPQPPQGKRQQRDAKTQTDSKNRKERPQKQNSRNRSVSKSVDIPTTLSLILGRPTTHSITLNVLANETLECYVEYGVSDKSNSSNLSEKSDLKTKPQTIPANTPTEILLDSLQPDKQYYYHLSYHKQNGSNFSKSPEYSFRTQRVPGSTYIFEIQGDSHPERPHQFDPGLYAQTLKAAAKDNPDFYIMMGDDFSVDTLREVSKGAVEKIYLNQRYFLDLLAHSVPLFLVNGNHEQAAIYNLDGSPNNVAVWAQNSRNKLFPQPAPNNFYTGNAKPVEHIGLLRNYYAWTWGDALFVVIDPYWHSVKPVDNIYGSREKSRGDMWTITLGDAQYKWFKETLDKSKAKYKFVFTHHVLGTGRGGAERADLFEWGGKNNKGEYEFDKKRAGWELPIHQLMVNNKVTIFFQGHDHVFAREELDGVVYQTMPEPADPDYALHNAESYPGADVLPNSGRVRVNVSADKIIVDYIRSYLPDDSTPENPDGEIAYSYEIKSEINSKHEVRIFKQYEKQADAESKAPEINRREKPEFLKISSSPFSIILGKPSNNSVTISLLANLDIQGYFEYGNKAGAYNHNTNEDSYSAGMPKEIVLESLMADKQYFYQFVYCDKNKPEYKKSEEYSFHTQRASGSAFKFAVQADPHNQDSNANFELYKVTSQNIKKENPDFLIDLGDSFMTEKIAETKEDAEQAYIDMRYYYGLTCSSIPLFLVNGNHDGEIGWKNTGENSIAVWSNIFRKKYYPCPSSDNFPNGSKSAIPYTNHYSGNYYAWEWGDALFLVIDPYWNTEKNPRSMKDNWQWTLGKEQYDWFAHTLQKSTAKFKFVFSHQLVGGFESGRSGAEAAKYYEWGGFDTNGKYAFNEKRPGWGKPIHQLMIENKVNIFFHGHDHFYAKQDLDGVVYQLVPQPDQLNNRINQKNEYGYKEGIFKPSSGHLLIDISSTKITVSYIRSIFSKDEKADYNNAQIEYEYSCPLK